MNKQMLVEREITVKYNFLHYLINDFVKYKDFVEVVL